MMFREEEELEKPDLGWKELEKENQRKGKKKQRELIAQLNLFIFFSTYKYKRHISSIQL